ncbi:MAG: hypothetical protein HUJ22_02475 [Gracilimonas sp.]|uniref:hypothetical protein n=1 Tax=Gracilimonas sp. TaxID=1974203 RepID=UPI001991640C|nr:hypothetical protein [Gracilimonas sp.]MBD3615410.1 hypothetical protein [Gracilimonas sp.]
METSEPLVLDPDNLNSETKISGNNNKAFQNAETPHEEFLLELMNGEQNHSYKKNKLTRAVG